MKSFFKIIKNLFIIFIILLFVFYAYKLSLQYFHEVEILKKVINRLSADTRVAEVLVTGVNFDEKSKKTLQQ